MSLDHAARLNAYISDATVSQRNALRAAEAKRRAHNNSHNEGGYGYNPHDDAYGCACSALDAAKEAAKIAYLVANWAEIKSSWNAMIAANTVNGQVPSKVINDGYKALGVWRHDMIAAKAQAEG